jgi:hypothetical protein
MSLKPGSTLYYRNDYHLNHYHHIALRQVHSLFLNEFSRECSLVLPVLILYLIVSLRSFSSCLGLLPRLPVLSSVQKFVLEAVPTQDVTI